MNKHKSIYIFVNKEEFSGIIIGIAKQFMEEKSLKEKEFCERIGVDSGSYRHLKNVRIKGGNKKKKFDWLF